METGERLAALETEVRSLHAESDLQAREILARGGRIAALETEVRSLRSESDRQAREILARIDGPPWEGSIRARYHALKGRVDALESAGLVLAEAQRERRKALDEKDITGRRKRGELWKLLAAATALVAVVAPYASRLL